SEPPPQRTDNVHNCPGQTKNCCLAYVASCSASTASAREYSTKTMNKPIDVQGVVLNISAVERETGLSKDVLRMWERRYAFPKPIRDENGERQYSITEVGKLRAIKRLMDIGMRPGKIIALSQEELNSMALSRADRGREVSSPALEGDVLSLLKAHDVTG